MFNGIQRSRERDRQAYAQRHAPGLDLGAVFQGFMEHWPHVERELPSFGESQKPKARQEKQRELALEAHREEGKVEPKPLKSKTPVAAAVKGSEVAPAQVVEAVARPFVPPPALPRLEKSSEAAIFPVPNHSAGQSGFSSTWSVAQKTSKEGVILSE